MGIYAPERDFADIESDPTKEEGFFLRITISEKGSSLTNKLSTAEDPIHRRHHVPS